MAKGEAGGECRSRSRCNGWRRTVDNDFTEANRASEPETMENADRIGQCDVRVLRDLPQPRTPAQCPLDADSDRVREPTHHTSTRGLKSRVTTLRTRGHIKVTGNSGAIRIDNCRCSGRSGVAIHGCPGELGCPILAGRSGRARYDGIHLPGAHVADLQQQRQEKPPSYRKLGQRRVPISAERDREPGDLSGFHARRVSCFVLGLRRCQLQKATVYFEETAAYHGKLRSGRLTVDTYAGLNSSGGCDTILACRLLLSVTKLDKRLVVVDVLNSLSFLLGGVRE
ncbi:hypothetical protein M2405_003988 [Rhodococcus erythropolis]|nr:hypothetical protein [Rhodococcus erythropolis]MCW2425198.1 hypothetical protein [Rhodococcus erythropolis]